MDCTVTQLPYRDTFQFADLVLDYIDQKPDLRELFSYTPDIAGIKSAIQARQQFPTNRKLLAEVLSSQYASTEATEQQKTNLASLVSADTFTICTAHQPNIFTGYLYFIYKIVHVIRIAEDLKKSLPEYHFVPLFYIGSEDNDLDELGQINVHGLKMRWNTEQKGAVGRMTVDRELIRLRDEIIAQFSKQPFGNELAAILQNAYVEGTSIADATFNLLNQLFAGYGLIVLQPDDARLKKSMTAIFKDDLFENLPHSLVKHNNEVLSEKYKVQVNPREINLFYLNGNSRERIVESKGKFSLNGSGSLLEKEALESLVNEHPENFSPNVVLRGLYQEIILPNIAFVGGGSEIAYWLELKTLFSHYQVPFPVLILRNSFLVVRNDQQQKVAKLGWEIPDLFKPDLDLMNSYVKMHSSKKLSLEKEIDEIHGVYAKIRDAAEEIDITLGQHISALEHKAVKQLRNLEKKMLRAEKSNYETQFRQLHRLKDELFPRNGLQERVENFLPYYAEYGRAFIKILFDTSASFEQKFGIITLP